MPNVRTFSTKPAYGQPSIYSAQRDAANVSMGQRVSLADERNCACDRSVAALMVEVALPLELSLLLSGQ